MSKITYLITGANRGIGLALVETFLARDNVVVIAAVRDPLDEKSTAALSNAICGSNSELIIIKIDSLDSNSSSSGIASIPERIDHLDVVIANAGVLQHYGPVTALPIDMLSYHFTINTAAPISLLQNCLPLLKKSNKNNCPKFVVISSSLGSIAQVDQVSPLTGAYGASKVAINYLMRKVHFEEPWLSSLVICPGWTRTEMGNTTAQLAKVDTQAPVPLDVSVRGVVEEIDIFVRTEKGRFASFDHKDCQW
ncbi:hypothetical protein HDV62DRAFT_393436 [Trichoderma sp. SZMC 28011]